MIWAIIVVIILILLFASRTEYFAKHSNTAYLIHEATGNQCVECREIRNYFYNALGNQRDLALYSYHLYEDHEKVRELEDKFNTKIERTPVLLILHDDGHQEIFKGYPPIYQAITMLRYHPAMERRIGW